MSGNAVLFNEAEHELEIRRTADRGIKHAVLLKAPPGAVKGGMGGIPAFLECSGAVGETLPGADNLASGIDVGQIAVHGIRSVQGKGTGNVFQNQVVLVVIVSVEEADHVSLSHADAFVHGIVDSLVRFGYPFHAAGEFGSIFFNELFCPILAGPVHHNVFHVRVGLSQNALQCVLAVLSHCCNKP